MVGFNDFKGLSEAELYKALVDLANKRTNAFGFTEAGKQIYDLAEGLKSKILNREDIVGSEEKEGMISDFVEDVKDDGISPELINRVLTDKFKVGKKYVIDEKTKSGKYVKDDTVQDFEAYLVEPKEEIESKVKEDFTEKVLMAKIQEKLTDLDKKYPELFDKNLTIDDAVALKEKLEQEKKELSDKVKENEKDKTDPLNKTFTDDFVNELLEDLDVDFTIDPKIRGNLASRLSSVLYKKLYGE